MFVHVSVNRQSLFCWNSNNKHTHRASYTSLRQHNTAQYYSTIACVRQQMDCGECVCKRTCRCMAVLLYDCVFERMRDVTRRMSAFCWFLCLLNLLCLQFHSVTNVRCICCVCGFVSSFFVFPFCSLSLVYRYSIAVLIFLVFNWIWSEKYGRNDLNLKNNELWDKVM